MKILRHWVMVAGMISSSGALAVDNYLYNSEVYSDKAQAEAAVLASVKANNQGDYIKEVSTTGNTIQYDLYFNPRPADPVEHYSPCSGECESESASFADWKSMTYVDPGHRHPYITCPDSVFHGGATSSWSFYDWVNITGGPWGSGATYAKVYHRDYGGTWLWKAGIHLYETDEWVCVDKTPVAVSMTMRHYKDAVKCPTGSFLDSLPDDEASLPTCKSTSASQYVKFKACHAPFQFNVDEANSKGIDLACITWCPPDQQFDSNLGRCMASKDTNDQCDAKGLNPIDLIMGEKQQTITDFTQHGPLPLAYIRSYRSQRSQQARNNVVEQSGATGWKKYYQPSGYAGKTTHSGQPFVESAQGNIGWRHNYQYHLHAFNSGNRIYVELPDGSFRQFDNIYGNYYAKVKAGYSLTGNKTDGWQYTDENNLVHDFSINGQLTTLTHQSGQRLIFNYDSDGRLISVSNIYGDTLQYTYDASGKFDRILLPDGSEILHGWDGLNNLVAVQQTYYGNGQNQTETEQYHYEDGRFPYALTGITDAEGIRYNSWTYNAAGQAVSSTHPLRSNAGTVAYDPVTQSASITSSSGHIKTISKTTRGRVHTVTGDSCSTSGEKSQVTFTYDSSDRVSQKQIAGGLTEDFTYSATGLIASRTLAKGTPDEQKTSWQYQTNGAAPVKITHPNGLEEAFTYNAQGQLLTHTLTADGESRVTRYDYQSNGLLSAIDGPQPGNADTYTYQYHPDNHLASITVPAGYVIQYDNYNHFGLPQTITDQNNLVTALSYDHKGRLTLIVATGSGGETRQWQMQYNRTGQLTFFRGPDGRELTYVYDDARRLIQMVSLNGDTLHYGYDSAGNRTTTRITGAMQSEVYRQTRSYDAINRINSLSNSMNHQWQFEYDKHDNLNKVVSPLNHTVSFVHDQLNRITSQTQKDGGVTSSSHNKQNKLTSVVDAVGGTTSFEFNGFGELTGRQSPDSGQSLFSYDEAGNVVQRTDANGIVSAYNYDGMNRLTQVTRMPSGNSEFYHWDELAPGKLTGADNEVMEYDYQYTPFGELATIQATLKYQQQQQTSTIQYEYSNGQIQRMHYPSGGSLTHYYQNGQLHKLEWKDSTQGAVAQPVMSNLTWQPFGGLLSASIGNGQILQNTWNLDYQLIRTMQTGALDYQLNYDERGNVVSVLDFSPGGDFQNYSYDQMARLLTASGQYGALSYSYDKIGNRLSKTEAGNTSSYTYADHRLTSVGVTQYVWDLAGNQIQRGTEQRTYDETNRLSGLTSGVDSYQYRYDVFGQRVLKDGPTDDRQFVYDGAGKLVAEISLSGAVLLEYIWLGEKPVAVVANQQLYFIATNHIDAPVQVTDSAGVPLWQASYKPFGEASVTLNSLPFSFNLRLPGQYQDVESGLHYNYQRDYDPQTGRYTQSDPIGLHGGINTYGYVSGNPVNYTDPTGLILWKGKVGVLDVGFGIASVQKVTLNVSACHKGREYTISASGYGVGPSWSNDLKLFQFAKTLKKIGMSEPSATFGDISLDDGLSYIHSDMFNGTYHSLSAGFALGGGVSGSTNVFGKFNHDEIQTSTSQFGLDPGSVSSVLGFISLDSVTEKDSCECPAQ